MSGQRSGLETGDFAETFPALTLGRFRPRHSGPITEERRREEGAVSCSFSGPQEMWARRKDTATPLSPPPPPGSFTGRGEGAGKRGPPLWPAQAASAGQRTVHLERGLSHWPSRFGLNSTFAFAGEQPSVAPPSPPGGFLPGVSDASQPGGTCTPPPPTTTTPRPRRDRAAMFILKTCASAFALPLEHHPLPPNIRLPRCRRLLTKGIGSFPRNLESKPRAGGSPVEARDLPVIFKPRARTATT